MELMDEWESNTNRRICWGSAGRYWVTGELQVGGAFGCCFLAERRTARGGSFPCLFSESLELERGRIGLASGVFMRLQGEDSWS